MAILRVRGELDALIGPKVEEAARAEFSAGVKRCIIDLSDATFIDSIGVGSLIRSHRAAAENNNAVLVAGATGMIAELIKVTQLHRIFQVAPTLDEAVAIASREVGQT